MQRQTPPQLHAAMLSGLFDYAGLFPPAGLTMDKAVRSFREYQAGMNAGLLNTFVIPASKLDEFSSAVAGLPTDSWRLSVLSADWQADRLLILDFLESNSAVEIASVETRVQDDVQEIRKSYDQVYVELPVDDKLEPSLQLLNEFGAKAKIRTGGLTAEAFPSSAEVAEFLVGCTRHSISFKATAGLHHPIRSRRPTCDQQDAPVANMHGFVNVLLGVRSALQGATASEVAIILEQTDLAAEDLGDLVPNPAQANPRSLFDSIGSCSFIEPVDDLTKLGWL
ncbi:MAG: hypothetical protein AAGG44_16740 [Planctomycetota bacterium]